MKNVLCRISLREFVVVVLLMSFVVLVIADRPTDEIIPFLTMALGYVFGKASNNSSPPPNENQAHDE